MKAARIVNVNEPLQIQDLKTPKPKGSQILIKVQSVGVCHSDVHVWEGYYEGIGGQPLKTTDRGVKYPLTPGHEIAGIVDSLGEQVKGELRFSLVSIPTRAYKIIGSYTGSIQDLIELVSLAKRGVINP